MQNFLDQGLPSLQPLLIRGVQLVAKGAYHLQGYRWKMRSRGDLRLGYWHKVFRPRDPRHAYPRRLVFIPGFGDTPLSWMPVLGLLDPVLRRPFDEVMLVDFPGFGGALHQQGAAPSIDLLKETLDDLLDSLKPHTILGHSLGGWLAAQYAADCGVKNRPRVNRQNYAGPQKLLLASPFGVFEDPDSHLFLQSLFQQSGEYGMAVLKPHLFYKEPKWVTFLDYSMESFIKRPDIQQFIRSFSLRHLATQRVDQIRAQVCLLWGEQDAMIPAALAHFWLKSLDASQGKKHEVAFLKNVGHSLHLESPVLTAGVLGQWLAEQSPHPLGSRWWQVFKQSEEQAPR